MKLGFEGTITRRRGGGGAAGGAGAPAAGIAGAALVRGAMPAGGTVAGKQIPPEEGAQPGEVKGEEAVPGEVEGAEACQSWPLWIWILALLIYFAAFLWRTFDKFKEQVEKREIRWGLQAVFAAAAFFFWYFFDFCREYWWFVIIALVGGAAVYLAYLCLFRREIREKSEKIETGEK